MPVLRERPPLVTWVYGLLGLIPFFAGAVGAVVLPAAVRPLARFELLGYGALILSFLGGARWGLEIGRRPVRPAVISASMLPSIVAFLLILVPHVRTSWQLAGMALAHLAQWGWDVRSRDTPPWYAPLRHVLTAGAVGCLLVGAAA